MTRTCGPECHNAREPSCDCVCGGAYHGIGSAAAISAMTRDVSRLAGDVGRAARHTLGKGVQPTLDEEG